MRTVLDGVIAQTGTLIVGKERQIRLALACILAKGHLLIEDLPGMGKTTLAQGLAQGLGLSFKRIQFTADMLPADILGISIYQPETRDFRFHPGPIFAQMVLADEINRATPKTQGALLEAMEERQVTNDGVSYPLPAPFVVVATQNPRHHVGVFPLPESQLDRFLMSIQMGYPDRHAEHELLRGRDRRELLGELLAQSDAATLARLQRLVAQVRCGDALIEYVQDLLAASRASARYVHGLSPRAGIGLLQSARAWALLEGRDIVLPEDVQAVAPAVIGHRLLTVAEGGGENAWALAEELLRSVPIP
ncbi:MAG: AAA family ATPase [Acidiferrobacterales bacterium]